MNSKGIVALKDTSVCMKCLKKKATHTYTIYGRGYGSSFDMSDTKFQCCDDCDKPEYEEWFNETEVMDGYVETYQHEEKIWDLIKSLPLEGQELFENRFDSDGYHMDAQDWIDYQLDELPNEKCNKYGFYSPEEKKAYKERFPNCECVIIEKYSDGSQSSHCPYGAFVRENGKRVQIKLADESLKASATCRNDDEFSFKKGLDLAERRLIVKYLSREVNEYANSI